MSISRRRPDLRKWFGLGLVIAGGLLLGANQLGVLSVVNGGPCPTTISGVLVSNPSITVTATLVASAQQAAQLEQVSSYQGLLAVYTINGGYTVGQVAIGSFGGVTTQTFGQLDGHHYNADGSCTAYTVVISTTTTSTSTATTTSSTSSSTSTTTAAPVPPQSSSLVPSAIGIVLIAGGLYIQFFRKEVEN